MKKITPIDVVDNESKPRKSKGWMSFGFNWIAMLLILLTTAPGGFAALSKSNPLLLQADLRADVNRDGIVYTGPASIMFDDKTGQATWTYKRGAIVLPNLDDDGGRCKASVPLEEISVTTCNDSKDNIINGSQDFADLAPLRLMPRPDAPDGMLAEIKIASEVRAKTRLFFERNGEWRLLPPNKRFTAQALREGVNLRLEALDIVRDKRLWDGRIDVIAVVSNGKAVASDRVQFHVAPLILQSDLLPAKQWYLPGMPWGQDGLAALSAVESLDSTQFSISVPPLQPFSGYLSILDAPNPSLSQSERMKLSAQRLGLLGSAYKAFHDEFVAAARSVLPKPRIADLPTYEDPWVQDMFEMAYATMPKPNGKFQIMHIALRSAQPQRFGAKGPLLEVLNSNVGIVEQWFDSDNFSPKNGDDSLNSTGNFGTIPPYSFNGKIYPLGRIVYGQGLAWVRTGGGIIDSSLPGGNELELRYRYPDRTFVRLLKDQGLQKPVVIDTAWLAVGHIDELIAFVPSNTPRGWKLVLADPALAWRLMTESYSQGYGATRFLSKLQRWEAGLPVEFVQRTIADIVNDPKMARAQRVAHAKIAGVLKALKAETGLQESEIIRVPVLFEPVYFNQRSFAFLTPDAANLVVLGKRSVAIAKQHGPLVKGEDIFEQAIATAFKSAGLSVHWVEDYIQAHGGIGEIHCQSNVLRDPGATAKWW